MARGKAAEVEESLDEWSRKRAQARKCAYADCGCHAHPEYGSYCGEHCARADVETLVPEACDCGHPDCEARARSVRPPDWQT